MSGQDARCARCGNVDELDVQDFGPFINQLTCANCWDAECENAWAKVQD